MKINRSGLFSAKYQNQLYNSHYMSRENSCCALRVSGNKNSFSKSIKNKYYNLSLNIGNSNTDKIDKIYGLISPKNNTKSFTKRFYSSKSQKNIFSNSNYFNFSTSSFPTMQRNNSNLLIKSPSSISHSHNIKYRIENEKLSQEIYYLRNNIKILKKQLYSINEENSQLDQIIQEKENEIHSIITKNNPKPNFNSDISKMNDIYDDSNYNSQFSKNDTKNNDSNLYNRIKSKIKAAYKDILAEENKISNLKQSKYYTKMQELSMETILYNEQINKINTLLNNSTNVHDHNKELLKDFDMLVCKTQNQEDIIRKLYIEYDNIINEENYYSKKVNIMKNNLDDKKKIKINNFEIISSLAKKKENLSNDQIFKDTFNNKEINKKIIQLQNDIELYKFQYRHSKNTLSKLKDRYDTLIKSNENLIKNNSELKLKLNKVNKKNNYETLIIEKEESKNKDLLKKKEEELSSNLKKLRKEENELYKTLKTMLKKHKNILFQSNTPNNNSKKTNTNTNNNKQQIEEFEFNENENKISFGITNDNPYYSNDDKNDPISSNKFNNVQFGNFAYVLFKNFESKGVTLSESQNKLITPFIEKLKIKKIFHNVKNIRSEEFLYSNEELTKIIMNLLENKNKENEKLISLFIGALFHNSNYEINRFINYLNILFSYTTNYINDEQKYISKLKNKYKDQMALLNNHIKEYLLMNSIDFEVSNHVYISLFKVKEIIEQNNIQIKDKYSEFIFYYLKKFQDENSKLEDIDLAKLNDLLENENTDENNDNVNINKEEFVAEITSEEYLKQLESTMNLIKKGLQDQGISFRELVSNFLNEKEIDGVNYEYISIDNLCDLLNKIEVNLSDLKLSCLYNKYCLDDELRLIDSKMLEKDLNEIV